MQPEGCVHAPDAVCCADATSLMNYSAFFFSMQHSKQKGKDAHRQLSLRIITSRFTAAPPFPQTSDKSVTAALGSAVEISPQTSSTLRLAPRRWKWRLRFSLELSLTHIHIGQTQTTRQQEGLRKKNNPNPPQQPRCHSLIDSGLMGRSQNLCAGAEIEVEHL